MDFCKVKNVKSPTRAHQTDAGIDFFVPDDLTRSDFELKHPERTGCTLVYGDGHTVKEIVKWVNQL